MSACHWWCYFVPRTLNETVDICSNKIFSSSAVAMVFSSWLCRSRRRCFLLSLCSPFLFPLLCALFPFFCVAEISFFICRRRRKKAAAEEEEEMADVSRHRVEEGGESGLLQRYLEDQMMLVDGSGYGCWGEDGVDLKCIDCGRTDS